MATRLDLAYDRQVHQVRQRMDRLALATWDGLGSWRDADYERTLRKLSPRLLAGRQQIANLTDAYVRKLGIAEFGKVKDGAVFTASTMALRGVDDATVLHRPFASTYSALAAGKSVAEAIAAGRERMADVTATGAQLAKTHAARASMERTRFTKFQRTLTGRENCALCVIASTQRYHREDLLPIHPGCDCSVLPYESMADEQIINEGLLEQTHELIASKLGGNDRGARSLGIGKGDSLSDYTELIISRDHGEIGPMLTWRSDKFTGSKEIM